MLYPKVRKKHGDEAPYDANHGAHVMAEFGFDVVNLANGRFASDRFRDAIGFEVAQTVLAAAFKDTYNLDMDEVFGGLKLAIGSYRKALSSTIPQMARVAWDLKKDEIPARTPGLTREELQVRMSDSEYKERWGTEYEEPGMGTHILSFFVRIVQWIGPFRPLRFRVPTPESEALFNESFSVSPDRLRTAIRAEADGRLKLENINLDFGRRTPFGTYGPSESLFPDMALTKWREASADRPSWPEGAGCARK
jgi:hypothetical protein